jgi:type IV secretion system protein VirB11
MICIGKVAPSRAEAIIKAVAGYHNKEVTRASPVLEGEFPIDGSRFAGQMPPVVPAPTFAIRKRAVAIFTLEQYVEGGIMTAEQCSLIHEAIRAHRNILVIGGTGSGKTTLVNAIINGMVDADPTERLVIIEDTGEIQCAAENFVQFHTSPQITMTALLKTTLRMRPDRILWARCAARKPSTCLWRGTPATRAERPRCTPTTPKRALAGSKCSSVCTPIHHGRSSR